MKFNWFFGSGGSNSASLLISVSQCSRLFPPPPVTEWPSHFPPSLPSGPAAKVELELLEDVEDLPDGQLRRHHRLWWVARGLPGLLENVNIRFYWSKLYELHKLTLSRSQLLFEGIYWVSSSTCYLPTHSTQHLHDRQPWQKLNTNKKWRSPNLVIPYTDLNSRFRRRGRLWRHDELLDVIVVLVVVVEGGGVDAEGGGRVGLAPAAHGGPLEVERGVVVVGVIVVVQEEAAMRDTTSKVLRENSWWIGISSRPSSLQYGGFLIHLISDYHRSIWNYNSHESVVHDPISKIGASYTKRPQTWIISVPGHGHWTNTRGSSCNHHLMSGYRLTKMMGNRPEWLVYMQKSCM